MKRADAVTEPTNGAATTFNAALPYTVSITVEGAADILFHRWNVESVNAKAGAAKGSAAKKTDDVESYVYRNDKGDIAIPGEYFRMSLVRASKFKQDPRSPRKSAMDLYKAGVVAITPLATLGVKTWDYLDTRRVVIQRNGVNRTRPAVKAGWRCSFELMVNLPEYIDRNALRETVELAGRLIGVGDFIPTFGRYGIVKFD